MTNAIGCDLSRYDISFHPELATGPIDFAFQKATEGYDYVDLKYDEIWRGVAQIGVRGVYHYQRSGLSWIAQADHFLETAAKHDYHIYALDVEAYGNTYNDTYFADAKRIIDYWRKSVNKKILIYTNGNAYKQMYLALVRLYGLTYTKQWLDDTPLWLANPAAAGAPALPEYRKDWQFHQYSWSDSPSRWGTGGTRVDENVYNGTLQDLQIWLGLENTQPPTETEIPMAGQKGVVKSGYTLTVRNASGVDTGLRMTGGDWVIGPVANGRISFLEINRANGVISTVNGNAATVNPANPSEAYMTLTDVVQPAPAGDYVLDFDASYVLTAPDGKKFAYTISEHGKVLTAH